MLVVPALVAVVVATLAAAALAARHGRIAARAAALAPAGVISLEDLPGPGASAAASAPAMYRAGEVMFAFRSGVPAARKRAIERAAGASAVRRLGPAIRPVAGGRTAGRQYLAPLELRVPAASVIAVVERLQRDPAVAYAEPDYMETASARPNDPEFSRQWGDENSGQLVPTQNQEEKLGAEEPGTPGADDRATKAWDVTTGSRAIVIGEVDTGVAYEHPDLQANIWSNPGGVGGCAAGTHGYNVLNKSCNPIDEDNSFNGHGTHVAGIMGAIGNNAAGVAGMNWRTTILPVRWMTNASAGATSALIEALQWLVAAKQAGVNVRVVNDSDTFFGTAKSEALSNEIETLGANNILFVTAAGNTGNNNDEEKVQRYPCSYDRFNEICVTASNNKDGLPSWANYGPHTVQLAAPGVSVYSTLRGNAYGYLSGGSMAAPQVAGAAALVLSAAEMSATQLRSDILNSVDKLSSLQGRIETGGRLDVCKALPGCGAPPAVPVESSPPTITGAAQQGQVLTESHGGWTNSPTGYAYQWLQCDGEGNSCAPISGATGQSYVVSAGDAGHRLRVQETASNAAGPSAPAMSSATAVVVPLPPSNTSPPTISGSTSQGQTLTEHHGVWTNNPTSFSYQWLRCDAEGNSCSAVPGATGQTYVLVGADTGHAMRVQEGAGNAGGSGAAVTSAPTAVVLAPAPATPVNTAPPTITGTAQQGQVLTESHGGWTNSPTSYAYQWLLCDGEGNGCAPISGATGQSYVVSAGDTGHRLRVQETASNAAGPSAPATSAASAVAVAATPQRPSNISAPSVSGTAQPGQTLTEHHGTWTNSPTSFRYQWLRCSFFGSGCTPVAGATAQTYGVSGADFAQTIAVEEIAANAGGSSAPAFSAPTGVVF
jgi:subtilisin family serine protease